LSLSDALITDQKKQATSSLVNLLVFVLHLSPAPETCKQVMKKLPKPASQPPAF